MAAQRGRPRRDEQVQERVQQVRALFRQERSALGYCHAFDGCPDLRHVMAAVSQRLPRAMYQQGTALDVFIQGAALDVLGELCAAERPREERLADFLRAYFFEGRTVTDIATSVLGLADRSHVSRGYRVAVFDLVARRMVTLLEHEDPLSLSAGLREALEHQVERWERASRQVSDVLQHLFPR